MADEKKPSLLHRIMSAIADHGTEEGDAASKEVIKTIKEGSIFKKYDDDMEKKIKEAGG